MTVHLDAIHAFSFLPAVAGCGDLCLAVAIFACVNNGGLHPNFSGCTCISQVMLNYLAGRVGEQHRQRCLSRGTFCLLSYAPSLTLNWIVHLSSVHCAAFAAWASPQMGGIELDCPLKQCPLRSLRGMGVVPDGWDGIRTGVYATKHGQQQCRFHDPAF